MCALLVQSVAPSAVLSAAVASNSGCVEGGERRRNTVQKYLGIVVVFLKGVHAQPCTRGSDSTLQDNKRRTILKFISTNSTSISLTGTGPVHAALLFAQIPPPPTSYFVVALSVAPRPLTALQRKLQPSHGGRTPPRRLRECCSYFYLLSTVPLFCFAPCLLCTLSSDR